MLLGIREAVLYQNIIFYSIFLYDYALEILELEFNFSTLTLIFQKGVTRVLSHIKPKSGE